MYLVSRAVRNQVRDRLPIAFEDLGESEVKNDLRPRASTVSCRKAGLPPHLAEVAEEARHRSARRSTCCLSKFRRRSRDGILSRQHRRGFDYRIAARRAHWFSIVARNTSFNYKGNAADSKQIARELGVRCVVEGSLGEAGSRSGSVASS